MESKGHILHWSLNPLPLQGDWDVLGFGKISLQNLLGDIFLGRCIRSRLKKTWGPPTRGAHTSDRSL